MIRLSLVSLAVSLVVSLVLLSTTVTIYAEDLPATGAVSIRGITYKGAGCIQGSANYTLSPDAKTLTVVFDRYSVEAGGENSEIGQKSCTIDIGLNLPPGWSYGLLGVDYRGFANLDLGAIAHQTSSYSFLNHPSERILGEQQLRGPLSDNYFFKNQNTIDNQGWSSCEMSSETLRIKTSMRVEGDIDKRGMVTVDSLDGELRQQYAIQWKHCSGGIDMVDIFRSTGVANPRQLFFSSRRDEGAKFGYQNPKPVFRLIKNSNSRPGLIPLTRCASVYLNNLQYLSTNPSCVRNDGVLGYVSSGPAPGYVPLYRATATDSDSELRIIKGGIYFGTNLAEANAMGYTAFSEVVGYVPATQ